MTGTSASSTTSPSARSSGDGAREAVARFFSSPTSAIAIALVVCCIVMTIVSDRFFTVSNIYNIASQSAVVGIAAVGATLIIITGGIDLSVGSALGLSGILAGLTMQAGFGPIAGIVVAIATAALIGAFNGASITLLRLAPFIVTLAVLGMARGLTLQVSQGQSIYNLPSGFTALGGGTIAGVPIAAILTLLVFVAGHFLLTKTTFGHKVFAVGGNREAARLAGINVRGTTFLVYVIAGVCVGIASIILVGRLGSATPTGGTGTELQVIAAVVIGGTSLFGGKGSMLGTLVGVLLIGVINNGLTLLNVSPFLVQFMQGALIFVAVILDAVNTRRIARRQLRRTA
ncbi:ABC transporter permease [Herbiconiux sp. P16]|uniref:ABC transporter permease n=1 Tax=Herbiconiux wuyangfengii TaxID=3342794 RepID=UPI0035BB892D